jgi:hypothetical protein
MYSAQTLADGGGWTAAGAADSAAAPPRRSLFRTRSARVVWLLCTIMLLSLADLQMTYVHLTTIGLGEANPIARLVMSAESPALLITWKLASVCLACGVFYLGRARPLAEIAAWFCVLVLVWLMLRWGAYSTEMARVCPNLHMVMQSEAGVWVTMRP